MADVVSWFEIPATDFDRAVSFYSTIFGRELPKSEFVTYHLPKQTASQATSPSGKVSA